MKFSNKLFVIISSISALLLVVTFIVSISFSETTEKVNPPTQSQTDLVLNTPSEIARSEIPESENENVEEKYSQTGEQPLAPEGDINSLIVSFKNSLNKEQIDAWISTLPRSEQDLIYLGDELGFGFWNLMLVLPATPEFAQNLSEKFLLNSEIATVEPNYPVKLEQVSEESASVGAQSLQYGAPWGLDRIDQRSLPLNGSFEYNFSGSGVKAYVVDTGVYSGHLELLGKVSAGFDGIQDGRGTGDCSGHGTHVAGTIAGTNYGVAKQTQIIPVRVLDCAGQEGSSSLILQGLSWTLNHYLSNPGPSIVNMSLVLYPSSSVDAAVQTLINNGIVVVAAAGNTGYIGPGNSCLWSPARVPAVLTVNASDLSDNDASFSNYGSCSDLYAPGVGIRSAGIASSTQITSKSGTSMATPHVAGAAALLLSENPGLPPSEVATRIISNASNIDFGLAQYGDPNKLLFVGVDQSSLVSRLAGSDRYGTSVSISSSFSPGVPVLYIATGENYPDALSAASAAAIQGGPLLLTDPAFLPGVVRSEIQRLQPGQIVVVGGTGAVSENVYSELRILTPSLRRDFGPDRFSTSRLIAERAFTGRSVNTAFIATGHDFPDALSAGSAASNLGAPVILVDGKAQSIDSEALSLLQRLGVTRVFIAGGTGVVSQSLENSLKISFGSGNVVRLSGQDRYSTSRAINQSSFASAQKIYLAVGTNFPDSLSGAALAGVSRAPLYIVPSYCVPSDVLVEINRFGATSVVLLGGTGVLSSRVAALGPC